MATPDGSVLDRHEGPCGWPASAPERARAVMAFVEQTDPIMRIARRVEFEMAQVELEAGMPTESDG